MILWGLGLLVVRAKPEVHVSAFQCKVLPSTASRCSPAFSGGLQCACHAGADLSLSPCLLPGPLPTHLSYGLLFKFPQTHTTVDLDKTGALNWSSKFSDIYSLLIISHTAPPLTHKHYAHPWVGVPISHHYCSCSQREHPAPAWVGKLPRLLPSVAALSPHR